MHAIESPEVLKNYIDVNLYMYILCFLQEIRRNADELITEEEKEKRRAEKRRAKKKVWVKCVLSYQGPTNLGNPW